MSREDRTEIAFDLLAQALDRVPAEKRLTFLSALALSLAANLDDTDALTAAIAMAEKASAYE